MRLKRNIALVLVGALMMGSTLVSSNLVSVYADDDTENMDDTENSSYDEDGDEDTDEDEDEDTDGAEDSQDDEDSQDGEDSQDENDEEDNNVVNYLLEVPAGINQIKHTAYTSLGKVQIVRSMEGTLNNQFKVTATSDNKTESNGSATNFNLKSTKADSDEKIAYKLVVGDEKANKDSQTHVNGFSFNSGDMEEIDNQNKTANISEVGDFIEALEGEVLLAWKNVGIYIDDSERKNKDGTFKDKITWNVEYTNTPNPGNSGESDDPSMKIEPENTASTSGITNLGITLYDGLFVNPEEFNKYKSDKIKYVGNLVKSSDCYKAKKLVETAKKDINAVKIDTGITLDLNKKPIDSIVSKLKKDLTPIKTAFDLRKANFALNTSLKLSQSGNNVSVKWSKVNKAAGYTLYVGYKGSKLKAVKVLNGASKVSAKINKINGKKINSSKIISAYVVAYKKVKGKKQTLQKSIDVSIAGSKNSKYANVKKLAVDKSSKTVTAGKTAKIKASITLDKKKRKAISPKYRFYVLDTSVASVDSNGKIKGLAAGSTYVYVFASNGLSKKVKVTVK